MNNSAQLTTDDCSDRHERAAEIIADYESQHSFHLPSPWRPTVSTLLLRGLSDSSLHLIFETLMQVEYEAGRLQAPEPSNPSFED
jgi:hypothetical protein